MKKYLIAASLMVLAFAGCKKDKDPVSKTVKVSYPTITYEGYSITGTSLEDYYTNTFSFDNIGFVSAGTGQLSINPTAYDSLLHETETVGTSHDGNLDPNTPGLYYYEFFAKNSNGYYSNARYYMAVTNISPSWDLSGSYVSDLGDTVTIDQMANGLYLHNDITGDAKGLAMLFVQTNDTTIVIPDQPGEFSAVDVGSISGSEGKVHVSGTDTTISYKLDNATINGLYPNKTFVFTKI
jgi:hypothetical protein